MPAKPQNITGSMPETLGLKDRLLEILGDGRVLTGDWEREFFSTDVFGSDRVADFVIRPESVDQLAAAAAAVTAAGYSLVGRGGGTSYTGGITPDRETSVMVDTSCLDRILEVNTDDMYVTVESGVTWKALHHALKDLPVRTPFWGPFSGDRATVGGSLSQNAVLWGSTGHDLSAGSVLGLEVVLADGSRVRTGSAGWGAKPFFRNYGPDLTGLFLGDTGALGIKTRATLRLMRRPAEVRTASFNFTRREAMSRAMAAVAREGIVSTCFGMDPVLQYQRVKRASMMKGVRALKGVIASAGNKFTGIRKAVRIAVHGKRFIDENGYSFHLVVEGNGRASVNEKLARVREICGAEGREIENSVPEMLHGDPFVGMTTAIGPEGERWAPMHGIFPLSDGDAAWARIEDLFDRHAERFDQLGIVAGVLLAVVSSTGFVIEPVFYWPGPRTIWYEGVLDPGDLAHLKDFPDDPAVNQAVTDIRAELNELFDELRAMHLQVGKKYHYARMADPATLDLIKGIKGVVDPENLMNPGSLGLK
ncbi:MAG: FAD-binding oxidoreductase [Xanthomonadales bacterium]|nr:FAD-binding oxidoreductase [Xanthomonadales bacterium]